MFEQTRERLDGLGTLPGDPTFLGWTLTGLYAVVTILAILHALLAHTTTAPSRNRSRLLWYVLAVALLLLGINKQLDLQTFVRAVLKSLAQSQGWYDHRSRVFAIVIVASAMLGAALFVYLVPLIRRLNGPSVLMAVGALVLLAFYGFRASYFVHADELFSLPANLATAHRFLELAGLLCMTAGMTWRGIRRARPAADHLPDDRREEAGHTVASPSIAVARDAIDL